MSVAIYIDSININSEHFHSIFNEIKINYNKIIIKNIYGDPFNKKKHDWNKISLNYAFNYKNIIKLSNNKNCLLSQIICDVCYDLYNYEYIDTYIIVSTNNNIIPLLNLIRLKNKKIHIFSYKNDLSNVITEYCNKFTDIHLIKFEFDLKEDNNRSVKNDKLLDIIYDSFNNKINTTLCEMKDYVKSNYNIKKLDIDDWDSFDELLIKQYSKYFLIKYTDCDIIIYIKNSMIIIKRIKQLLNNNALSLVDLKNKLILVNSSFDERKYNCANMNELIKMFSEYFKIKDGLVYCSK